MMPNLEDLPNDIRRVLQHKQPPAHDTLTVATRANLGARIANHFGDTLTPREGERKPNRVWFSQLGTACLRKEWYTYRHPEKAEPLQAAAKYKFLYGNVIEEITLDLCKAAGHNVEREQEKIELPLDGGWSLTGRIDAVIDGHVVDVKSMSTYSFNAQGEFLQWSDDLFGYRWQVSGYQGILGNPSKKAALLCVDKTLGHIKLSWEDKPHTLPDVMLRANLIAKTADLTDPPPRRDLEDMGKSGNKKLDTYCSYCPYKKECWPGLRGFLYSKKVVWLAHVEEEPKVPEILYAPEE